MARFRLASLMFGLFALVLIDMPAAHADAWDLPKPEEVKTGEELVAVGEGFISQRSLRRVIFDVNSSGDFGARVCDKEFDSGDCNLSDSSLQFEGRAIMGPCQSASESNCIESFALSTKSGSPVPGIFIRSVDTQLYDAVPSKGLPAFKSTPLFSVAGFTHEGGANTYAPVVRTNYKWNRATNKFYAASFEAHVVPYTEKIGSVYRAHTHSNVDKDGKKKDVELGSGENCVWEEKGRCGTAQLFSPNVKVHLSIRVSSEIVGWFRGRLTAPEIKVESIDATTNRLSFIGEPVTVSRFGAIATKENTTADEQKIIAGTGGNPGASLFSGRGRRYVFSHWGDFKWLEMFRDIAKDTSLGESLVWNVSTIDKSSQNPCLADRSGLLGIVTTNATVYDGKVPEFVDGELIYKVAGMHFAPDGKSLVQGTYDLVMRSETARCLYDFSSAPVTASISVVSSEGIAQVATTVSGERDGWLYLSAKNFNFSSPTIKVRLAQEKVAAVAPTPTPSPNALSSTSKPVSVASSITKKKTITCVKGSTSKRVVAVNPKCPKGYKKA